MVPKKLHRIIGPGLLFAGNAIGTSHLILSTRAGANYGMIFFWVIAAALLLKYPFFEFGVRYANATGSNLLKGYKRLGKWALLLFLLVIFVEMFAVTAAVGAVTAGLLNSLFGFGESGMALLMGGVLMVTSLILVVGKYKLLDNLIKVVSVVLFVTVTVSFIAVLLKGPVQITGNPVPVGSLWSGVGLTFTISLIGFMPTALEISAIQSIWTVEKFRTSGYTPKLKESLFDFNLGYGFTAVLAFMFLIIGAFTAYGTGELLEGNSVQFSNRLLALLSINLGSWAYWVMAIAAVGTIYGTLIVSMDAFARSFILGIEELAIEETTQQRTNRNYNVVLTIITMGAFILFSKFPGGMIKVLEAATICSFLTSPIIAILNLKLIRDSAFPQTHAPGVLLLFLSWIGLIIGVAFSAFYLYTLIT